MYVCLCNGIRETELKRLGREGVRDVHEAFSRLGSDPVCTCCLDEAEMVLKGGDVLQKTQSGKPAAVSPLKLVG